MRKKNTVNASFICVLCARRSTVSKFRQGERMLATNQPKEATRAKEHVDNDNEQHDTLNVTARKRQKQSPT